MAPQQSCCHQCDSSRRGAAWPHRQRGPVRHRTAHRQGALWQGRRTPPIFLGQFHLPFFWGNFTSHFSGAISPPIFLADFSHNPRRPSDLPSATAQARVRPPTTFRAKSERWKKKKPPYRGGFIYFHPFRGNKINNCIYFHLFTYFMWSEPPPLGGMNVRFFTRSIATCTFLHVPNLQKTARSGRKPLREPTQITPTI